MPRALCCLLVISSPALTMALVDLSLDWTLAAQYNNMTKFAHIFENIPMDTRSFVLVHDGEILLEYWFGCQSDQCYDVASCDALIEYFEGATTCNVLGWDAGCDCTGCSCPSSSSSSSDSCLNTCFGESCDYWGGACSSIESVYECDCSDCTCAPDNFDPLETGHFSDTSSIRHVQYSVTKSWASVIVGKMVTDGLLASEDVSLGELFRDDSTWDGISQEGNKRAITVKEILTMTSGFYDGGTGCCHQNSDSLHDALSVNFYQEAVGTFAYTNPSLIACKLFTSRIFASQSTYFRLG